MQLISLYFTAEKCIRASPDQDYTNGFFVALFVKKDSEMEQKPTENNGVLPKRKRKHSNGVITEPEMASQSESTNEISNEESMLPLAHVMATSSHDNLSPKKKRRKRNKKAKKVNVQGESQHMTASEGNVGSSNVKKKRKRKKKNKTVSVCS